MTFLDPIQGKSPSLLQLFTSYGIGLGAAALVLTQLDFTWKTALLAALAFDWCGGLVANAAPPVRGWWRTRPGLSRAFLPFHLMELPVIYWLTGGGTVFYCFCLVMAAKLAIFELGKERYEMPRDPAQG